LPSDAPTAFLHRTSEEDVMMFSSRRRPTQKPAAKNHPTKPATPSQDVTVHLRHLDYNLRPLSVESLSHYIEPIAEDVRFKVH
jgi:hypothetical protein